MKRCTMAAELVAALLMVGGSLVHGAIVVETFESFPRTTILTTQIPGLTISADTGTPTIRTASSPVVPGEPQGLAHIPYFDPPDYLVIDFAPGTLTVGAIVDFGIVGRGVQLTAFDGLGATGNILGTDSTTSETFISVNAVGIQSARFENLGGASYLIDNLTYNLISEPTILDLDIKPGPSNNTVPLNGNGKLQMAILANEEFNVMDVDIASLLFGDPILVDGGATPLGATSDRLRDVNHDGFDDLLVGFSISDLVDGGALAASSVEGRLTGELLDGTPIFGSDIVRMVPQNNGGGLVTSTVPEPTTSALALAALCLAMSRRRSF